MPFQLPEGIGGRLRHAPAALFDMGDHLQIDVVQHAYGAYRAEIRKQRESRKPDPINLAYCVIVSLDVAMAKSRIFDPSLRAANLVQQDRRLEPVGPHGLLTIDAPCGLDELDELRVATEQLIHAPDGLNVPRIDFRAGGKTGPASLTVSWYAYGRPVEEHWENMDKVRDWNGRVPPHFNPTQVWNTQP